MSEQNGTSSGDPIYFEPRARVQTSSTWGVSKNVLPFHFYRSTILTLVTFSSRKTIYKIAIIRFHVFDFFHLEHRNTDLGITWL